MVFKISRAASVRSLFTSFSNGGVSDNSDQLLLKASIIKGMRLSELAAVATCQTPYIKY